MTTATFKSHNKAVQFLNLMTKAGIPAKLISLDSSATEGGCSYGVRLSRKLIGKARSAALKGDILPERWL